MPLTEKCVILAVMVVLVYGILKMLGVFDEDGTPEEYKPKMFDPETDGVEK